MRWKQPESTTSERFLTWATLRWIYRQELEPVCSASSVSFPECTRRLDSPRNALPILSPALQRYRHLLRLIILEAAASNRNSCQQYGSEGRRRSAKSTAFAGY